ncbi:unnamed protein product [Paramecium sonneborni]|uniref:Protein kinase domain-containing protein n=1 Tax=Paramecium sonneborni TaxID=65129 RepID=A0A8S1NVL8_9CILI|nr:unnamed protein product [Paramecium sonneborni]
MNYYSFYNLPSQPQTVQPQIHKKLHKDQYEILQIELGSGTYGKVKLAINNVQNKKFAIKIVTNLYIKISKSYIKQIYATQHILNELNYLSGCKHKNIVEYVEHFEDRDNIYIVLEYCGQGTLDELIKKKKKLNEEEAFHYFYQIAQAILYLHEKDIVHRDIKADNILLQNSDVKVCDFNWSTFLPNGGKAKPCFCGTTEYMPPEIIRKEKHDKAVDIWSMGILLYYMLHGELLFRAKEKEELHEKICNKQLIKFNQKLSTECLFLLQQMLAHQKRINIYQVLNSDWVIKMLKSKNNLHSLELTPIKNRSTAQESTRFSFQSNSTRLSNSKFTTKSQYIESPQKIRDLNYGVTDQNPKKVKSSALDQNNPAFRVEKRYFY